MPERADGFTLLEITIVMAIFAVIAVLLYGVFARTLEGKQHAESAAEQAGDARMALSRITQDLQAARVSRSLQVVPQRRAAPVAPMTTPAPGAAQGAGSLFLSRNHQEGGAPFDDLAFTAFSRRPAATTFAGIDLATLRYFVAPLDEAKTDLGLYREAVYSLSGDSFDPDNPNLANSTLVLEHVRGLEFRFFDGSDWVQEWDSSDPKSPAAAPPAVEITLSIADGTGGAETYQTAIDLPAARQEGGLPATGGASIPPAGAGTAASDDD